METVDNTPGVSKRVVLLGMIFASFMIVSNLTGFKVVEIKLFTDFSIHFPAPLIFFPFTYFFDNILTEVYGFKVSRLVIWGGLACSVIVTICIWIAVQLPASPQWNINTNNGARAYDLVFTSSQRIFFASATAYFCGEFLNSVALAKFKVYTKGRHFFLRVMTSTSIAVGLDSIIFCNIAFLHILSNQMIWEIILTQYAIKVGYEFIMLPITYAFVNHLKRVDHMDYFDTHTKFNIFSLRLVDRTLKKK